MTRAQLGRPVGASGEVTRQRIIVATMRCVARAGYSRATIREIARTAKVTSASLYNYFPNKSELIKAAIAARTDVALPRLREAASRPGGVIDRIEAVLDESGKLMREYPDLAAFEWAIRAESALALDSEVAGSTGFQAFREIIESIIEDALPPGRRGGDLFADLRPDRVGGHSAGGGLPRGAGRGQGTDQGNVVRPRWPLDTRSRIECAVRASGVR